MPLIEILAQLLIEFLGELVIVVLWQIAIEIIFHAFYQPLKHLEGKFPTVPVAPYLFMGLISGWLSLLLFPGFLLTNPLHKLVNLILTPVVVGFVMAGMGKLRNKKGQGTLKMDQFFYGFLMALSFAVVRFTLAT